MAWRDNLTCDTVAEAVEELADTFTAVDLARKSTQVQKLNGEYNKIIKLMKAV